MEVIGPMNVFHIVRTRYNLEILQLGVQIFGHQINALLLLVFSHKGH